MVKKNILGVDVGTGSIKSMVGMLEDNGGVAIKGIGVLASAGVTKGAITNFRELAVAVKEATDCAAMAANVLPDSIYLGIGGADTASVNSIGSVAPSSASSITKGDVERASKAAVVSTVSEDNQILHSLPIGYWVDGKRMQEELLGQKANRLEVETHIVTASQVTIERLTDALAAKGIHIAGVMSGSIAGAEALTETTAESDYLVMDIGAGATDLVLCNGRRICMSASVPLGGNYITNDIMQGLGVDWLHAEGIKRYYARLNRQLLGQKMMLDCNDYGTTDKKVSYDFLYNVVESRVEEIVAIIHEYLKPALSRYQINKVLLTGGSSMLPSIAEHVDRIFGTYSLPSKPQLPQEYSHPANTACYGILRSAAKLSLAGKDSSRAKHSLLSKIKKFI